MHLKIFLVGLCGLCLMLVSAPGVAAEPDLRIVERAAAQDGEAVRALLEDGVDANTARADGVTARCSGRRIGMTSRPPTRCCALAPTSMLRTTMA